MTPQVVFLSLCLSRYIARAWSFAPIREAAAGPGVHHHTPHTHTPSHTPPAWVSCVREHGRQPKEARWGFPGGRERSGTARGFLDAVQRDEAVRIRDAGEAGVCCVWTAAGTRGGTTAHREGEGNPAPAVRPPKVEQATAAVPVPEPGVLPRRGCESRLRNHACVIVRPVARLASPTGLARAPPAINHAAPKARQAAQHIAGPDCAQGARGGRFPTHVIDELVRIGASDWAGSPYWELQRPRRAAPILATTATTIEPTNVPRARRRTGRKSAAAEPRRPCDGGSAFLTQRWDRGHTYGVMSYTVRASEAAATATGEIPTDVTARFLSFFAARPLHRETPSQMPLCQLCPARSAPSPPGYRIDNRRVESQHRSQKPSDANTAGRVSGRAEGGGRTLRDCVPDPVSLVEANRQGVRLGARACLGLALRQPHSCNPRPAAAAVPAGWLAGWLAGRLEERGRGGGTPDDCGRRCCCWYACWLLIPKPLRVVVCACESMVTAWFGVALVARPLDPDDDYDGADAGTDYSLSRFVIAGDRRALPRALCTASRFPNEATSAGGGNDNDNQGTQQPVPVTRDPETLSAPRRRRAAGNDGRAQRRRRRLCHPACLPAATVRKPPPEVMMKLRISLTGQVSFAWGAMGGGFQSRVLRHRRCPPGEEEEEEGEGQSRATTSRNNLAEPRSLTRPSARPKKNES
ncbi:hypothetical protein PCL_09967 [Purpureocillium lilacinum]|uniref:Uncharacterized protein n=1 Tax=Purpureocillium lilacinum TaxID=33203 RepID=A0A2U3EEP7_PURLI|nr:hypothetical protein PCL_09967 [Purpureocillium lilacinum]